MTTNAPDTGLPCFERTLPRVYARPGSIVFAGRGAARVWHAAVTPAVAPGRDRQVAIARTLCGTLARMTGQPYRDLWPLSLASCSKCWRAWERRNGGAS